VLGDVEDVGEAVEELLELVAGDVDDSDVSEVDPARVLGLPHALSERTTTAAAVTLSAGLQKTLLMSQHLPPELSESTLSHGDPRN